MGSSVILPSPGQPAIGADPSFRSGAIPNVVSFGFEKIDPPASLYIQRDDVLVFQAVTQSAQESVSFTVRLLLPLNPQPGQPDKLPPSATDPRGFIGPGYIQTSQRTIVLNAPLVLSSLQVPLTEGYLLSVSVVGGNSTQRGNTFVRAFINRGNFSAISPNVVATLVADYVTQFAPVGWPGGRFVSPTEGPGAYESYAPANPAAGADFTVASGSPGRVRLVFLQATFTASAAVANRVISFQFLPLPPLTRNYSVQDTAAVVASQVVQYNIAPGSSNVRGAGAGTAANPIIVTLPMPSPATAVPQAQVKSVTGAIQAADQWSGIQVVTEEWFDLL